MAKTQLNEQAIIPFVKMVNDSSDLVRLINELEGVKRLLFQGKLEAPISQRAKELLSEKLAHTFDDLEVLGLEPTNDSGRVKFIDELMVYMRSLPKVKVVLAFDPSISFVAKINEEISTQLGKKVILDVTVDQHIVAGAAFEFAGKYREYSMAKDVENLIAGYIKSQILPKREES